MNILITGGAKGIGKELVDFYCQNNNTVIINYLTSSKEANELKDKYDSSLLLSQGDITEDTYLDSLFQMIKSIGSLDVVINNAAYTNDDYYKNITRKDFIKTLNTNIVSPFMISKKYSEYYDRGIIINMCSTDGIDTFNEYNISYAASKAALINLTKSLTMALSNFKIYGIIPNYVATESVKTMDQEFLKDELIRIKQNELIEPKTIVNKINKIITGNYESGYMERIDCNE